MNNTRTDAEALTIRFTLKELRKELHTAEVNCLPDQDDYGYWLWYADIVNQAIDIKKKAQPKPIVIPGHIDIEAIKQCADIVTVVENYAVKLKKAGHDFKGLCPFHKERTPSFTVYPEEKRYHCYGCQADGDVIGFVMKIENCDFKSAALKVAEIR
jgi:hypothetical protein